MKRRHCEFLGFIEVLKEESIIIFHSCSTNLNLNSDGLGSCNERHTGNTPRSIMTKGSSTRRKNRLPGSLYGNFDPGDQDKLMITYKRQSTHDYTMFGACGVVYQGNMHFFGGGRVQMFDKQHFFIETQRSGKMVKMTKMKDLDVSFENPLCSSFEITSNNFPWFSKNIVVLCFKVDKPTSCYSFDGKINYISQGFPTFGDQTANTNYPLWK